MINIANINESDRYALFKNTAAKMGMTEAIIEKDFWVCYRGLRSTPIFCFK